MAEITFVKGFNVKAKEFDNGGMILKVGLKVDDLIEFLYANIKDTGWVNIDIKKSKDGKWYACLDEYQPKQSNQVADDELIGEESIPF